MIVLVISSVQSSCQTQVGFVGNGQTLVQHCLMMTVICSSASCHKNPGRLLPIMAYAGRLHLKGVPSSGFRVVEISLVKGYERAWKSVILVDKREQNSYQIHIMAVKNSRKHCGFVTYSYLKDSAFTAVKRDAKI